MAKHLTVVYYNWEDKEPSAFYVLDANKEKVQQAFDSHSVFSVRCITIEEETPANRTAQTLFTENDVEDFLNEWEVSL